MVDVQKVTSNKQASGEGRGAGVMEEWKGGMMECWKIGTLEFWNAGMLSA
jgi:hypothetical protein